MIPERQRHGLLIPYFAFPGKMVARLRVYDAAKPTAGIRRRVRRRVLRGSCVTPLRRLVPVVVLEEQRWFRRIGGLHLGCDAQGAGVSMCGHHSNAHVSGGRTGRGVVLQDDVRARLDVHSEPSVPGDGLHVLGHLGFVDVDPIHPKFLK